MAANQAPSGQGSTPSTSIDGTLGGRLVSGAVVVVVIGVTAIVLYQLTRFSQVEGALADMMKDPASRTVAQTQLQSLQTNIVALFGAFTTLVGTAIAAYFGISAANASSQHAVNAITATTQTQQANSELQQKNSALEQQNGAAQSQLTQVRQLLAGYSADSPNHDAVMRAQALLQQGA